MKVKIERGSRIIEKSWSFYGRKIDWNASARSKFQTRVKMFLYPYWRNHVVYEELKLPRPSRLSLDFYNATLRLALEVQGRQHEDMVPHFHGEGVAGFQAYQGQIQRDEKKERFCDLNHITLVEIYEKDELTEKRARELKLI